MKNVYAHIKQIIIFETKITLILFSITYWILQIQRMTTFFHNLYELSIIPSFIVINRNLLFKFPPLFYEF